MVIIALQSLLALVQQNKRFKLLSVKSENNKKTKIFTHKLKIWSATNKLKTEMRHLNEDLMM